MRPYACESCGMSGVKLWRTDSQTPYVTCVLCTTELQGIPLELVNRAGTFWYNKFKGYGDPVHWRIPAIPDKDGQWFGYTSVSDEGLAWWGKLPVLEYHD